MKTLSSLLLIALLTLLAVSPLFASGLPSIADAPIHLFRTMELVSIWADGVLYPRWAPNLAFGYGYPLFDFAPPLPYFIAGAFHVAGLSLETSIKLLAILCMAAYAFGMYLFTRNVLGERAALVASAAYLYTPFRFREVLLYGGNYPQILAIGLFPWVLWAFERVVAVGGRRYVLAGALTYGALILSHNFHAFVFTPLLLIYVFLKALSTGFRPAPGAQGRLAKLGGMRAPAAAACLGLALTAFFWAPALYDLQYTAAQADYYLARSDFRLRLLSLNDLLAMPVPLDARADNPYVPFSLGIAVVGLATLGAGCLAFLVLRWRGQVVRGRSLPEAERQEALHLAFFLVVLLAAAFTMSRPAILLWERLPFLPYAEFPWRFMGIANLAAAFLAGGSVRWWERAARIVSGRALLPDVDLTLSLLALIGSVAVYFYPTKPFIQWDTPRLSDYIDYEVRSQNVGTTGLAEYLPRWAATIPTSSPLVGAMREGKAIEKLDRSTLPAGVQATALAHSAAADRYRFRGETGFRATFFTFYFPGWRAFLDGQPVPIQIVAPLGLVAVDLPAGEHELLLRFGETPFRLGMDLVSLLALIGLAGWLVREMAGRRATRREQPQPGLAVAGGGDVRSSRPDPADLPTEGRPIRSMAHQGLLAALLLALFVAKVAFVDSRTGWFRRTSPPDEVVGVGHPMLVQLEDNVDLLGYDVVGGERAQAGQLLHVRLYWQARGPVQGDHISFVHLDAPPDGATLATGDNYQPGDPQSQIDMPSPNWNPALYVRDEHRLALPDSLPPVAYALQVGLYERGTGRRLAILPGQAAGQAGDTIFLQQIHVLPAARLAPAALLPGHHYRLGEDIELLGYRVDTGGAGEGWIQPGGTVTVTLHWRALRPAGNYTVFAHLLDAAGQRHGQHDSVPLDGRYPTQYWLPGQVVEDTIDLSLASDSPPGEYRVAIGMYELANMQRLAVSDEGGHVLNDAILLEPALQVGISP